MTFSYISCLKNIIWQSPRASWQPTGQTIVLWKENYIHLNFNGAWGWTQKGNWIFCWKVPLSYVHSIFCWKVSYVQLFGHRIPTEISYVRKVDIGLCPFFGEMYKNDFLYHNPPQNRNHFIQNFFLPKMDIG